MTGVVKLRQAFLKAYQKSRSIEAAAKEADIPTALHESWLADPLYNSAWSAIQKELAAPPKRRGRPKKTKTTETAPKRRGRPPKVVGPEREDMPAEAAPTPPAPEPAATEPAGPAPPPAPEQLPPRGYTRIYVEGESSIEPSPEPQRRPPAPPEPEMLEITVPSDLEQKRMVDEFGELDRLLKLHSPTLARFETLKKAIKSWVDDAPDDADAVIEGTLYRLHLSQREKERRIRDLHEVVERIGLEKALQIASVPLAALQKLMGSAELESLLIETRSGSRRIRCIPKFPAAPPS